MQLIYPNFSRNDASVHCIGLDHKRGDSHESCLLAQDTNGNYLKGKVSYSEHTYYEHGQLQYQNCFSLTREGLLAYINIQYSIYIYIYIYM